MINLLFFKKLERNYLSSFFLFFLVTTGADSSFAVPDGPKEMGLPAAASISKKKTAGSQPRRQNKAKKQNILSRKVPLSPTLSQSLASMLGKMAKAHESLIKANKDQFDSIISKLIAEVRLIPIHREAHLPYHRRVYLTRQLRLIEDHLRFVTQKNLSRRHKTESLKKIYKELIHIRAAYALESKDTYGVYYCSKDDNAWIQNTNMEVHNPFNSAYKNCGRKMQ